jgi:uncharacterized membrane protein SpoIIM required for sporulation
LGPAGVRRLGELQRVAVAELARQRRRAPTDPATVRLESLVARGHAAIYGRRAREATLAQFALRGFWRRVAESPWTLLLAAALTVLPALVGYLWALVDPGRAGGVVPGAFASLTQPRPHGPGLDLPVATRAAFATSIFTHNIAVAFAAFAGGVTAGALTAVSLFYNGATLGLTAGLAVGSGNGADFVRLVLPHGALEISCVVVAGSAGFRLADALVRPGRLRRSSALAAASGPAVETALGAAAWLVLAGLVEGFVTPSGLPTWAVVSLGLGLAGVFWGLVVVRGRRHDDQPLTAGHVA